MVPKLLLLPLLLNADGDAPRKVQKCPHRRDGRPDPRAEQKRPPSRALVLRPQQGNGRGVELNAEVSDQRV